MGWTETYYNEKLSHKERREEIDKLYTWQNEKYQCKVIKSTIKNNTHYAAVEVFDKSTKKREVTASVTLLSQRRNGRGYWYGYKSIPETCGPNKAECPESILKLLSDTTNEYSNAWRKRCHEYNNKPNLSKLPEGTKIRFVCPYDTSHFRKGQTIELIKTCTRQFYDKKTYRWLCGMVYWLPKHIPNNFEIVQEYGI